MRTTDDALDTLSIRTLIAELTACEDALRGHEQRPSASRRALMNDQQRLLRALRHKHG